jgi:hypothetical protein
MPLSSLNFHKNKLTCNKINKITWSDINNYLYDDLRKLILFKFLCIENPFNDNNKGICFTHDGKKIKIYDSSYDRIINEYADIIFMYDKNYNLYPLSLNKIIINNNINSLSANDVNLFKLDTFNKNIDMYCIHVSNSKLINCNCHLIPIFKMDFKLFFSINKKSKKIKKTTTKLEKKDVLYNEYFMYRKSV